eukprot:TRINITY_DN11676_c0_g2_i1.p2 TRINITY_DN11676_c0_g2~~TRINITY_DN11676_c0_g2_i1.p2  ORF type:complete len:138 (-),score=33.38 TRINITY_DN11676_c0_g2_i1:904-1317(-)
MLHVRRCCLSSSKRSTDVLMMNGAVFHGYHGFFPAEHELGQKFIVDLELRTDVSLAGRTDSITDTVDMTRVYKDIHQIVASEQSEALLENLGERIAAQMLEKYASQVSSVKVVVKKPQVPLSGVLEYAAIEIERSRR